MYTEFFHIDSRARYLEQPLHPPNNYRFDLPRLLRGVREIEVFRAEIPSSMNNITDSDPPFEFTVTRRLVDDGRQNFKISLHIPPGAYTLATVVSKLNELKNASQTLIATGYDTSKIAFSGDETTKKLSLKSTNIPDIDLMLHTFYPLGIDRDIPGVFFPNDCTVTAEDPVRLHTPTVLFLSFPNIRVLGASASDIEVHSNLFGHAPGHAEGHVPRGCIVARFQLTAGQWNVNYLESEFRVYLRTFQSGALNLDHLDIVFTDPLGRLINFNGADHSLFLRIAYESR